MLNGNLVTLRLVRQSDLDRAYSYFDDAQRKPATDGADFVSSVSLARFYNEGGVWGDAEGVMSVSDREDNPVGFVRFVKPHAIPSRRCLEISFAIFDTEHWGKGYMTEALALFVPYLFATRGINRLQAVTPLDNVASQKVLEKSGFQYEGTLRSFFFYRGKDLDVRLYSILREEAPDMSEVRRVEGRS